MSLREEDKQKTGCSSRGLGFAAAAIGVGIGAALYYMFSKEGTQETPDTEGATSAQWNVETAQTLTEDYNSSRDYTTVSENTTTDTSMNSDSHVTSSSDHEEILTPDDSYHPIISSSSESDANDDSDWMINEFDTAWPMDTRDYHVTSTSSEFDASNSDWTPIEADTDIRDDPSSSSSESDANDELYSGRSNNESDTDIRDDPSSSSSESDANEELDSGRLNTDIRDDPSSSSSESDANDEFNSGRINNESDMDTRDDLSSPTSVNSPDSLISWEIESSSEVPHYEPSSNSILGRVRARMVPARPARRRERSWSLEECSICFDVILKNQEVMSLPCTHHFHQSCILPWLQEHQTCPNCRKAVD